MVIGFGLVYCVGVNERENPKSRMKMLQSNIHYSTTIKVYIVSIEEIYGVLSLSMEFHLCLWSSIFVYGVLSLSMEFYLCLRSSIFVCGCWVHVYGNVWVHVCGCWVQVSLRMKACLTVCLFGLSTVGSLFHNG